MIRTPARTAAAAVAALALTATLGACGSDGGDDGGGKADDKSSERKAPRKKPAGPASKAQLGRQMLTAEEVPASVKKTLPLVGKGLPPKGHAVATPSRCQPVLDAVSDEPDKKAAASVQHKVQSENLRDSVHVTLASYSDAASAEAALEAAKAAAGTCKGGFTSVNKEADYRDKYTRVAMKSGPSGGDSSLAYDVRGVASDGSGGTYAFDFAFVRVGGTLATFNRYSDKKVDGSGPLPSALVAAQVDKVKAAAEKR